MFYWSYKNIHVVLSDEEETALVQEFSSNQDTISSPYQRCKCKWMSPDLLPEKKKATSRPPLNYVLFRNSKPQINKPGRMAGR